ncbi:MAG: putative 2OG-Fe(II) oxygenase [Pyrinomonadaceae bacterium]
MLQLDSKHLELTELFPSPLLKYFWANSDDLNRELIKLIVSKEKEHSGISTTNVGGWHSKKDFQNWDGECVKVLLSRMLLLGREMLERFTGCNESEMFSDWTIQAWANINQYGHYNKFHTHIRNLNLWSGVYYVSTGIEKTDNVSKARIVFADQHQVTPKDNDEFRKRYFIEPKPGLMLIFPSSLGHRVESHYGTGNRITIAFNLKNDKFTTINYDIEKSKPEKS